MKPSLPPLSLLIVNSPYLEPIYLDYQIDALNRQTSRDFQVFYLNQEATADALQLALQRAEFGFTIINLPFPWLAGTCCWDLISVLGHLLEQPVHGDYFSYLHKECLPAPDFVASLLSGIAAAEAEFGTEVIYRLNQLHCQQTVSDLGPQWPVELAATGPLYWIDRTPFAPSYVYAERAWQEDAFAMPVALARRSHLFSCVSFPLFFQDLYDLIYQLPSLPGFESLRWVHLGQPAIWHLSHPRAFREYRREFLQAVRAHPQLFGHLALYELAAEDFDYQEDFSAGERIIPAHLHRFVHYMRYSERGTVTHWRHAYIRSADRPQS
ncbi:MAG: hypothetical protein CVV27_00595 [Candidatus Melainabacteria bacterium HGW-Melainabacteria-1]|nr:MAG: hypothetical protein CVV27_00595 [Candidatus Melainabacteria bacterium HGW-Melainabacteria-1]